MRKKALTVGLLLLVIAVWAFVLLYIFSALQPQTNSRELLTPIKMKMDYSHLISILDTQKISVNYPDPFLKFCSSAIKPVLKLPSSKGKEVIIPSEEISFIEYRGVIINAHKRRVIFLTIHGHDYVTMVGKRVEQILILGATQNEVFVNYHNRIFKVKRK